MIFVYNETSLELQLQCVTKKGTTELRLEDTDKENSKTIITTTDERIAESMRNRYGNGRALTHNPSRDFVLVDGEKILIDPESNSMVVSKLQDESGVALARPENLIKNMVVLVIKRGTRFFFPMGAQLVKPNIMPFGRDYTVVLLYIKAFNWSKLSYPLSILLKSADGEDNHMELKLQSKVSTDKAGKEYAQNVMVVEKFTGEFPTPRVPRADAKSEHTRDNNRQSGNKSYNSDRPQRSDRRDGYSVGYASADSGNRTSREHGNKDYKHRDNQASRGSYNSDRPQKRDKKQGGYNKNSGKSYSKYR